MSYSQFAGYTCPSASAALTNSQMTSTSPAAGARACCENGRPIMTDPHTGQTICSCQYGTALLNYPRVPGLAESVYSASAYAAAVSQGYVSLGAEGSAFYSPLAGSPYDLKDSPEAWRTLAQPGFPYDPAMAVYPYGTGYGGLDLNSRRKNATRENTNTLKAWLYEHRKNPYPTKGEKIMLAIITKMTLTQVSTWFANARRRLKKENKMTWSPRNRSEDGSDSVNGDGESESGRDDHNDTSSNLGGVDDIDNVNGDDGPLTSPGDHSDREDGKDGIINVEDEDSNHSLREHEIDQSEDELMQRRKRLRESENLLKDCSPDSDDETEGKNEHSSRPSREKVPTPGSERVSHSGCSDQVPPPRPKIWSISEFLQTSSSSSSSVSRPATISTQARPAHNSGYFYLPASTASWGAGRYAGMAGSYPLSLTHTTLSYPYSLSTHTTTKPVLSAPSSVRGLDSLRDGEKGLRPNGLFSPARDLDVLRSAAVASNRLVESNI